MSNELSYIRDIAHFTSGIGFVLLWIAALKTIEFIERRK